MRLIAIMANRFVHSIERKSMPKGLFLDPQQAVASIEAHRVATDLMGTARRAIHATLWIGAHFGYQLKGSPMGMLITDELRMQFLEEIDIVLDALKEYDAYYPELKELDLEGLWELDPATSILTTEEIHAVDYRHLLLFLHVTGLRNQQPPATS
jgi:hypothetical protein